MMEYELINPSDLYTFVANDFETAALVVFVLGTAYGAESKEGTEKVPIFIAAEPGAEEAWYAENFGRNTKEGLEAKWDFVVDALDSMMLGKFRDRERYNAVLGAIDDFQKREYFKKVWQGNRSSCNNIGEHAHAIAVYMREHKAKN